MQKRKGFLENMKGNRILDAELRENFLKILMDFFAARGEDVQQTGSNELAFPCVDSAGNDKWIQIVVKVPTGGREEECYDGYGIAESYKIKLREKEEKKREQEEKKKKKIERDKKKREEKEKKE